MPRLGKGYTERVPPRRPHSYRESHLHYLTANTYRRRARSFDPDRSKLKPVLSNGFAQTLGDLREELGFRIIGYVPMPGTVIF